MKRSEEEETRDHSGVGDSALARQAAAISASSLSMRWFIVILISAELLFFAGLYWLHQMPSGNATPDGGPIVEVRLVDKSSAEPELIVTQQSVKISVGRPEPLVEAPEQLIPEEAEPETAEVTLEDVLQSTQREPPVAEDPPVISSGTAAAFQKRLLAHISRYRRFPKIVGDGMHGTVQVLFTMHRDGRVSEVWVRASSGHAVLDQSATDTVLRAQPLPEIPANLPGQLTILLPLSFDAS